MYVIIILLCYTKQTSIFFFHSLRLSLFHLVMQKRNGLYDKIRSYYILYH